MDALNAFLDGNPDPREYKRALAVKMALQGYPYVEIMSLLNVCAAFVSKWKSNFLFAGVEGLKLAYRGFPGRLSPEQKEEIITWLQQRNYWNIEELADFIYEHYQVEFSSRQSYSALLHEAGITWKKAQGVNPKKDEEQVASKKKEIMEKLKEWEPEVKAGQAVVLTLDECHLNWGDMKGYVWGKVGEKAQIPIVNDRERQTYYGALNCVSGKFHISPYKKGDSQETIKFIKFLQKQYPNRKLKLLWDGASYHRSEDFKKFLELENEGLEKKEWKIECVQFAAYAPEQNPTEDIWKHGKKFIRECWHLCKSFAAVKFIFEWGLKHEVFDFPKVQEYRKMLQLT